MVEKKYYEELFNSNDWRLRREIASDPLAVKYEGY